MSEPRTLSIYEAALFLRLNVIDTKVFLRARRVLFIHIPLRRLRHLVDSGQLAVWIKKWRPALN